MNPNSLDFIRRGTSDEQSEYAAAQKPPVSLTVPQGEAGPRSSDADVEGAPASEGPTCSRCKRPVRYIGPSLLIDGTDFWLHVDRPEPAHLPNPVLTEEITR
jgi:hypothetical protein